MALSLHKWQRGPRSNFSLGTESGVYALFLCDGAELPVISPGEHGLIYVWPAANLKKRCHFNAQTGNHSPRKSLAVLLMDELSLVPIFIPKPSSRDTWGLDAPSEARLSAWMYGNLELAIEHCDDPETRETELVGQYAPPLNLTKCVQSAQHRYIKDARAKVSASLQGSERLPPKPDCTHGVSKLRKLRTERDGKTPTELLLEKPSRLLVGSEDDTAEAIAARYRLNPKSYRQRLRSSIGWYRKPQDWTFPVGSLEWNDMIQVAEEMTR